MCGGTGTRLHNYSLPKPLNYIYGKPAIYYVLQATMEQPKHNISSIDFVVSPHLIQYQFESTVRQTLSNSHVELRFYYLPYITRGPVESAYLGTLSFDENEPVVFLDNDILYPSLDVLLPYEGKTFLGYSLDNSGSEAFCFLRLSSDKVVNEIQEKKRISNWFGCGVYGFSSLKQFRSYASSLLSNIVTNGPKELYMSIIYSMILLDYNNQQLEHNNQEKTQELCYGVYFPSIHHIGSLVEVVKTLPLITPPKLRICVDLDNTLVTSPSCSKVNQSTNLNLNSMINQPTNSNEHTTGNTTEHNEKTKYESVKPIESMIAYVREMKKQGHTIIIHTARRMKTCNHNEGAAIASSARTVLDTLEKFNIPYDELLFGKPIADIYIDDKAWNPYVNNLQTIGFFNIEKESLINFLPPNKNNKISMCVENGKQCVKKEGPAKYMMGEIYYHKHLPNTSVKNLFPTFVSSSAVKEVVEIKTTKNEKSADNMSLVTEHIKGIPCAYLWKTMLLNTSHINLIFENMRLLHNTVDIINTDKPTTIHISDIEKTTINENEENMRNNYLKKLEERFETDAYNFDDIDGKEVKKVQEMCYQRLKKYCDSNKWQHVDYIHGDLWFSNIILTYDNNIKWLDMKGICWKTYTTGGDKLYDYAKLYQSFLGYDSVLNGWDIETQYQQQMMTHFEEKIKAENIEIQDVRDISYALILGTLPFIESVHVRKRVFLWCMSLLYSSLQA